MEITIYYRCESSVYREDPGPAVAGAQPPDGAGIGCTLWIQHSEDCSGPATGCQTLQH